MTILRRTLLATAAAATALGLAGGAMAQDKTKVGFVYVGPVGDGGWTHEHDMGRKAVEAEFGDQVETVYVENVAEGPDAERVMTQMALNGADLIFTTSFGFMDPTINVAKKFPDVKFEHATGYKRADNVSTYSARFYEGRAVQGVIAGHMTESNIVGYIGSFPIPEVIRGINSAYIHAKKVNPDVQFKIVWAYTWFDPAKEADAAKVLIEQGADVILQHTDSTAPHAAAAEKGGVITFGQASDMAEYAPSPRVSSIIDNWAPYYIDRVQAVMDGDLVGHVEVLHVHALDAPPLQLVGDVRADRRVVVHHHDQLGRQRGGRAHDRSRLHGVSIPPRVLSRGLNSDTTSAGSRP